jgi:DNA-binding MarR family transcriptional regulator
METRDQRPIGQLLGRALRAFRVELYQRAIDAGYHDIREAHLQVFGALDWRGTRLTDMAARANMTPPSMAELVDELQAAGYLGRRPDPSDGRAKLIRPTRKGRRAIARALRAVQAIEGEYSRVLGAERFEALRGGLESLIDHPPTRYGVPRPAP